MKVEVGIGNYVSFLRFWKINHRITCLKKFHKGGYYILSEIQTKFFFSNLSITFSSTTTEWNNVDRDLRNSESYTLFCSIILKFIRPSQNSFHHCQNLMNIKLVTRLFLSLTRLRKKQLKHSFHDTLKPSVTAGWTSNPSTTFYSIVPRIPKKYWPSWATWIKLTHIYLKLLCNFWQIKLFLGIRLTVSNRILMFITLLLTTSN